MGNATLAELYAGDTSDVWELGFVTSAAGVKPVVLADLDPSFTCRIAVLDAAPAINRAVTIKNGANTRFRVWLTPAETAALGEGDWTVGIELSNATLSPPLVQEVQRRIRIRAQAVI